MNPPLLYSVYMLGDIYHKKTLHCNRKRLHWADESLTVKKGPSFFNECPYIVASGLPPKP